jgi:Rrf2 family transcriptional regulator, iron-sulfur cluster assembly transcription factor
MFSRTAEYAIRAMTFLALQPAGKLSGAREIAQAENIPMQFLWKILQNLARRKLVRSFKGVRGGYQLARSGDDISVDDVVRAADESSTAQGCVLGLASCSEETPCPLHHTWKGIREQLVHMLEQTTVAELARVAAQNRQRRQS